VKFAPSESFAVDLIGIVLAGSQLTDYRDRVGRNFARRERYVVVPFDCIDLVDSTLFGR
jgi:hypothetical protein